MKTTKYSKVLSYVGVFLLGGVMSFALAGTTPAENLEGSLRVARPALSSAENFQLAEERGERQLADDKLSSVIKEVEFDKEVSSKTPQKEGGVCSVTNCDLMDRLNDVHNTIGTSTSYTLTSMLEAIHSNVRTNTANTIDIRSMLERMRGNQHPSMSLVEFMEYYQGETVRRIRGSISTSWTLDNLAQHISQQNTISSEKLNVLTADPNGGTWTLEQLADHITATCQQ